MKTKMLLLTLAVLLTLPLSSQNNENKVINTILTGYSVRNYVASPVSDQDLEQILKCGLKAPSARNTQLWKFTVVRNASLISQMVGNAPVGNVVIIVSGPENAPGGIKVDFDCALATESMFIAAQGLGLGARIYTNPINNINAKKADFQIPEGYRAIAVLRIGVVDKSVDAVTSASTRKKAEEVINYVK